MRGFLNVCFSCAPEPHRALRFFHVGHPDVFSVLIPLHPRDLLQLWLPRARYPVFLDRRYTQPRSASHASESGTVDIRLVWDVAGAVTPGKASTLWLDASVTRPGQAVDRTGACAIPLPADGSYAGFRHLCACRAADGSRRRRPRRGYAVETSRGGAAAAT